MWLSFAFCALLLAHHVLHWRWFWQIAGHKRVWPLLVGLGAGIALLLFYCFCRLRVTEAVGAIAASSWIGLRLSIDCGSLANRAERALPFPRTAGAFVTTWVEPLPAYYRRLAKIASLINSGLHLAKIFCIPFANDFENLSIGLLPAGDGERQFCRSQSLQGISTH